MVAAGLKMTFLPIEKTYNWTAIPSTFDEWPAFRTLDFEKEYGLKDLSADSIDELT
jgi:hypothetical protein